ncbi:IS30 family transposase [Staphylococcus hominis]
MRKEIEKLLSSDLSSLHIAKQTEVQQSTIYRLRSRERSLDNLGLKQCEKLYDFSKILFNSEEDQKQHLLVKRASLMGMLQNLELNEEEREKLEKEKSEIENKLDKLI